MPKVSKGSTSRIACSDKSAGRGCCCIVNLLALLRSTRQGNVSHIVGSGLSLLAELAYGSLPESCNAGLPVELIRLIVLELVVALLVLLQGVIVGLLVVGRGETLPKFLLLLGGSAGQ